ncbi:MAG: 1-acyl-sn-glycerol-3-phosphate acyltransferase [Clostridia bacterium]|nr:1-acyl-sn-glycerol-3-phosphate acyltransferase [Clostridia bacterium]
MKIKTKNLSFDKVQALPKAKHIDPKYPNILFRTLVRLLAIPDLIKTSFSFTFDEKIKQEKGPFLILMNHSSFLDLEIVSRIFYPMPYSIICTSDGFIGKNWLMRMLGCIPTQKFVTDMTLIRDMRFALKKLNSSILMYPEASYSFDGTATTLPENLGRLMKLLDVPVITVITQGAFAFDPLYNCLQQRKVKVSATVKCLATQDEVRTLEAEELTARLEKDFSFDNFAWQKENNVKITEPFRADGLERILYKCAHCGSEGTMKGKGTTVKCSACSKEYFLDELGQLNALDGETEFSHIPSWYAWEREQVKKELVDGTYELDTKVKIGVMTNFDAIYFIGNGRLIHSNQGFTLTSDDGILTYNQKPHASYGLYSDYYWYELGDVISIGDKNCLYYCFPEKDGVVAKTRLAAEELFKLDKENSKKNK